MLFMRINSSVTSISFDLTEKDTNDLRYSTNHFDSSGAYDNRISNLGLFDNIHSNSSQGEIELSFVNSPIVDLSTTEKLNNRSFTPSIFNFRGSQSNNFNIYMRTVFRELCFVNYWKLIDNGKLPRKSEMASFLLHVLDVSRDDSTIRDWDIIIKHIEHLSLFDRFFVTLVSWLKAIAPVLSMNLLAIFAVRREKQIVYLLLAYIEIHETTQEKISLFFKDTGYHSHVANVIDESSNCVDFAKTALSKLNSEAVQLIKLEQYRWALLKNRKKSIQDMEK